MVQVKLWEGTDVNQLQEWFNQWSKEHTQCSVLSMSMFTRADRIVLGVYFVQPQTPNDRITVPKLVVPTLMGKDAR